MSTIALLQLAGLILEERNKDGIILLDGREKQKTQQAVVDVYIRSVHGENALTTTSTGSKLESSHSRSHRQL